MSQRLTRKEVKRDEVRESMARIFDYILGHRGLLIGILSGVVILIAAGAAIAHFGNVRQAKAQALLAEAIESYSSVRDGELGRSFGEEAMSPGETKTTLEAAKESLESLRSEFGNSNAAEVALIYLADIAVRTGNLDEARTNWEEYLSGNAGHMLAAQVQANLFALGREQGRGESVEAELRALLTQTKAALPEDALLYQLGLTLESVGKSTEAEEVFARLVEQHPQSPFAREAQQHTSGGFSQTGNSFSF